MQPTHKEASVVSSFSCPLYLWGQTGKVSLETSAVHTQDGGMLVHCASDNDLLKASARITVSQNMERDLIALNINEFVL